MNKLRRWWDMLTGWLRDRPPKPDPQGQAMIEEAQEEVISTVERQADDLIARSTLHDPQLARRVEEAAQRRKFELERDLIRRRREYPR